LDFLQIWQLYKLIKNSLTWMDVEGAQMGEPICHRTQDLG
jgi:hypothetical protein